LVHHVAFGFDSSIFVDGWKALTVATDSAGLPNLNAMTAEANDPPACGDPVPEPRRLAQVHPRTMVEQAAEAVVAAAARGVFLPGDRLVEAEIARELGISRVPVREALRLLESQGIVVSTPYKGMRLMQVTNRMVAELMRVRAALESLALREILAAGALPEEHLMPARRAAQRYEEAAEGRDAAILVAADEAFHGELCRLSGNRVLHGLWLSVARQLSVVWGLGHDVRPKSRTAAEHRELIDRLARGDVNGAQAALERHLDWHAELDFEVAVQKRRQAKLAGRAPLGRVGRPGLPAGAAGPILGATGDRATMYQPAEFTSQHWQVTKPAATGRRGMVASQSRAAAEAGLAILDAGGSAADAAVGAAFAWR
jgi:DNA-binding GntR family transcriptional regulator